MTKPPYVIVTTVWGREYIDFYKEHILPYTREILPPGFAIACSTTKEHVSELDGLVDIIFDCGTYSGQNKYRFASAADMAATKTLHQAGVRRFVYQNPDALISKSAFLRIVESEFKVITLPGIRIWKDLFLSIYDRFDDNILENAMTVLHPLTLFRARRGGYRKFVREWPSCVYDITPERIRCQALHRHPLMVDVPEHYDFEQPVGTVDDRFLGSLGYPLEAYDNLTSSDQGYALEFSSLTADWARFYPPEEDVDIDAAIAAFAASNACDDIHRWFLQTEYEWRPKAANR
ncbi:hypothetical protein [Phenylobacterium sp.]|uniref:hypothetical protein n=1 Tax=Phenylobacterium sp. TaxID=1871053 RepID=UPI0025DCED24|nr:hypothetical protein [Phenylobacterium sp.]MCA6286649.1 hypothetical protein [Phenylobacterium sp.]MCA6310356.1 hypothetical protein [Phenylobacterium sp.]MCA6324560.1 hypothetical protein [Phenylobacterium sp.]MCA6337249.1 hypothetical protein [Phenylobacterium sp.]MCA6340554.1 hypothetical protein [Phenylobacterium sp.]